MEHRGICRWRSANAWVAKPPHEATRGNPRRCPHRILRPRSRKELSALRPTLAPSQPKPTPKHRPRRAIIQRGYALSSKNRAITRSAARQAKVASNDPFTAESSGPSSGFSLSPPPSGPSAHDRSAKRRKNAKADTAPRRAEGPLASPEKRRIAPSRPPSRGACDIDEPHARPVVPVPQRALAHQVAGPTTPPPPPYPHAEPDPQVPGMVAPRPDPASPSTPTPSQPERGVAGNNTAPTPATGSDEGETAAAGAPAAEQAPVPTQPATAEVPAAGAQNGGATNNAAAVTAADQQMQVDVAPADAHLIGLPRHTPQDQHENPLLKRCGADEDHIPPQFATGTYSMPPQGGFACPGLVGDRDALLEGVEPAYVKGVNDDPADHWLVTVDFTGVHAAVEHGQRTVQTFKEKMVPISREIESAQVLLPVRPDSVKVETLNKYDAPRTFIIPGRRSFSPELNLFLKTMRRFAFDGDRPGDKIAFTFHDPVDADPSWLLGSVTLGINLTDDRTKERALAVLGHIGRTNLTFKGLAHRFAPATVPPLGDSRVEYFVRTWDIHPLQAGSLTIWQLTGRPPVDEMGMTHREGLKQMRLAIANAPFAEFYRTISVTWLPRMHLGCNGCGNPLHATGSCYFHSLRDWKGPTQAPHTQSQGQAERATFTVGKPSAPKGGKKGGKNRRR